ncbi:hypothetical protein ACERK3_15115 [Phycisphaerales bacterium AB-hyl4]|uniref:Dolichyl-phosphate-mannose-protein mannosyltransferase n=1 Tax=Natronomicrosphaera hydrolytica TaxID=3242702 RepID=A0ABV4U8K5_9BACT
MTDVPSPSLYRPMIGFAFAVTLLATIWVASQGDVVPVQPLAFVAVLAVVMEAAPVLAGVWLGAAGLGYVLRVALVPTLARGRLVVQLGLGMAAMLVLAWALAWAGLLHMASAWGLCAAGAALLGVQWIMERRETAAALASDDDAGPPLRFEHAWSWMALLWALPTGLLVVAATCPPGTLWRVEAFGYDVMSYHLQLPREWLAAGAMAGLEHNVYSYLPSLVEAGYMQLGAMHGSVSSAIYTAQLFHASLAVLAAAGVTQAVRHFVDAGPAVAAGAVLLAVPWVLVTGSLAYNEMAVLAFMAVALVVLFDVVSERWGGAAVVGLLVGAATLAKLTAGFFVAVPLALVLLTRWNHALRWRQPPRWQVGVKAAAIAGVAGALMLAPYLVRNFTWTGNPVFPFATGMLGAGHWDDDLTRRWDEGHGLAWDDANRFEAFHRQWLLNTGYGALGGDDTPVETQNIARFDQEGGFPLLWVVMLGSVMFCVTRPGLRRAVGAMGLVLGVQFAFWLLATHLQSRFLIPTLVPAALLAGIGFGRLAVLTQTRVAWLWPLTASVVVLLLTLSSLTTLFNQTQRVRLDDGRVVPAPLWALIDSRSTDDASAVGGVGGHPINDLPTQSRTLLVADSSPLLYLERPFVYHTAFDASPLGEMIREAEGDAGRVNKKLREAGITHIWVSWSELDRLHATYGHDRDVTRETLGELIDTGWQRVSDHGRSATLFALP